MAVIYSIWWAPSPASWLAASDVVSSCTDRWWCNAEVVASRRIYTSSFITTLTNGRANVAIQSKWSNEKLPARLQNISPQFVATNSVYSVRLTPLTSLLFYIAHHWSGNADTHMQRGGLKMQYLKMGDQKDDERHENDLWSGSFSLSVFCRDNRLCTCVACSDELYFFSRCIVLCILCNKIHTKIVLQYKLFTDAHCI